MLDFIKIDFRLIGFSILVIDQYLARKVASLLIRFAHWAPSTAYCWYIRFEWFEMYQMYFRWSLRFLKILKVFIKKVNNKTVLECFKAMMWQNNLGHKYDDHCEVSYSLSNKVFNSLKQFLLICYVFLKFISRDSVRINASIYD